MCQDSCSNPLLKFESLQVSWILLFYFFILIRLQHWVMESKWHPLTLVLASVESAFLQMWEVDMSLCLTLVSTTSLKMLLLWLVFCIDISNISSIKTQNITLHKKVFFKRYFLHLQPASVSISANYSIDENFLLYCY